MVYPRNVDGIYCQCAFIQPFGLVGLVELSREEHSIVYQRVDVGCVEGYSFPVEELGGGEVAAEIVHDDAVVCQASAEGVPVDVRLLRSLKQTRVVKVG